MTQTQPVYQVQATQLPLLPVYGMTETMPTHGTPLNQEKIGSCGKLLAGVSARVVDIDNDRPLPPNTPGELLIKSPGVSMAGSW